MGSPLLGVYLSLGVLYVLAAALTSWPKHTEWKPPDALALFVIAGVGVVFWPVGAAFDLGLHIARRIRE